MSAQVTPAEESTHVSMDPARLKDVELVEFLTRFLFGAVISLVAGLLAMRFGYHLGGLFLAFPAILPASLTLIEKKEGSRSADIDAMGAVIGALGMVAFAVVAATTVSRLPAVLALGLAAITWLVVSVGLYFLVSRLGLRPYLVPFAHGQRGGDGSGDAS